ncbi:MFS transporter [bacterium]|nr:MFS transporter [bacterium]
MPKPAWLNRNIVGMSLASFFSDLCHEAATAALPAFLISIHAPPGVLGTIEGVADGVSTAVKIGAGYLGDRLGARKPIAVLGYTLTGLSKASFYFATAWPHILAGRSVAWLGRGMRGPVRDAMLAASVPKDSLGRAFGFHRAMDSLGAVLGPLLVLLAFQAIALEPRQVFLWTLIPGIASALSFGLIVVSPPQAKLKKLSLAASLGALPPAFRLFLLGVLVFGLGDFAVSMLILRAQEVLGPLWGKDAKTLAIGLYVFLQLIETLVSFPIGKLADKVGKGVVLGGAYGLFGVAALALTAEWSSSLGVLAVVFVLKGISAAGEEGLRGALASELVPDEIRATANGTLAAVAGLGDLFSSVGVGLLWTSVSPRAAFGTAAALAFLGAAIILFLKLAPLEEPKEKTA